MGIALLNYSIPKGPNKGGFMSVPSMTSAIISLIAGILILIFPRVLNYVVAIYLIIMGLLGIFG